MDILKPLVLEEKLDILTPFIDFDEMFFADIEDREDGHFNGEVYIFLYYLPEKSQGDMQNHFKHFNFFLPSQINVYSNFS